MKERWIFEEKPQTNASFGNSPNSRSLNQLLECGVIAINKPPGPSSHQLASWARDILGISRIGHGGTLDPFATGLLTLLCGRATKLTEILLKKNKGYIAVIRFKNQVNIDQIKLLLEKMTGEIYNVPPKESAVKIQVRSRNIRALELIDYDVESRLINLRIECNAGTYVRTLSNDLGLLLDSRCELLELHRHQSGIFNSSMACTMQQLNDAAFLWKEHDDDRGIRKLIAPIESILSEIPMIVVKDGAVAALSHGAPLARPGIVSAPKGIKKGSQVLLSSLKGEAVAIAKLMIDSDSLKGIDSGHVSTVQTVMMSPGIYPQTWSKDRK